MTGSSPAGPAQSATRTFPDAADDAMPTRQRTRTDRVPGDPLAGERIEPTIVDHGQAAGASSAYEKLHGLGPEFGEGAARPQRSRAWRILTMAAVFAVGAGVGLAAAVWLGKPSPEAALSPSPPLSAGAGNRPAPIRGISPSELPYDGAPPPAAGSSSSMPDVPEPASASAAEAAPAGAVDEGSKETASTAAPVPARAAKKADAEGVAKPAKPSAQGASVAGTAAKRKSVARTDREIERIRRQVDEELKKKTDHGRAPANTRPGVNQGARKEDGSRRTVSGAVSVQRVSSMRASLARCERRANFISREYCRWQVCNGSWGRYGCPSYPPHASSY